MSEVSVLLFCLFCERKMPHKFRHFKQSLLNHFGYFFYSHLFSVPSLIMFKTVFSSDFFLAPECSFWFTGPRANRSNEFLWVLASSLILHPELDSVPRSSLKIQSSSIWFKEQWISCALSFVDAFKTFFKYLQQSLISFLYLK